MKEAAPRRTDVEGFVLAGGAASRMGRDKALADWRGRPLLAWALDSLAEAGVAAAVVAPDAARFAGLCARFVTTETPGLGPAEGLRAALAACRAPWALVLAVDMPLVGAALLGPLLAAAAELDAAAGSHGAVCWGGSDGGAQPLPALCRRDLLATLDAAPRGGPLRRALDAARPLTLGPERLPPGFPQPLAVALRSLNSPADLRIPGRDQP